MATNKDLEARPSRLAHFAKISIILAERFHHLSAARAEGIALLLADLLSEKYANRHGKHQEDPTPAIDMLMAYHWSGNVLNPKTPSNAHLQGVRLAVIRGIIRRSPSYRRLKPPDNHERVAQRSGGGLR